MQAHDWNRFMLRIPVNAGKEVIYRCWSTQDGLESWFLRSSPFKKPDGSARGNSDEVSVNDSYEWRWHGWPDDVVEKGTVLEANGKDLFSFSFGKAGNVTIRIVEEADLHIVELLQDQIPTDEEGQVYYHIGCSRGWLFYLTNLKSILEGGIDLRNKNVDLKDVVNA
jgi:uncharacterized protein YndB with AHSA1/START domain